MENFYSTLNITEDAGNEDIKTAFRILAKQYHPDTSKGDSEKFRQVHHACKILSDPESRRDYDRTLKNFQNRNLPPARGKQQSCAMLQTGAGDSAFW